MATGKADSEFRILTNSVTKSPSYKPLKLFRICVSAKLTNGTFNVSATTNSEGPGP